MVRYWLFMAIMAIKKKGKMCFKAMDKGMWPPLPPLIFAEMSIGLKHKKSVYLLKKHFVKIQEVYDFLRRHDLILPPLYYIEKKCLSSCLGPSFKKIVVSKISSKNFIGIWIIFLRYFVCHFLPKNYFDLIPNQ